MRIPDLTTSPVNPRQMLLLGLLLLGLIGLSGCFKSESEAALETDANGYLCQSCRAKFYTERAVFADICPNCKSLQLAQVVGFACQDDGFVTVAARGAGFVACEKCRKHVSSLVIPREEALKAWGAPKKTRTEVMKSES